MNSPRQAGTVRGLFADRLCGQHAGVGYDWLNTAWTPRLFVEYNYASGDNSPANAKGGVTGGSIHTFQNLFPTNHPLFGTMDLFSWQNMEDVHPPQCARQSGQIRHAGSRLFGPPLARHHERRMVMPGKRSSLPFAR